MLTKPKVDYHNWIHFKIHTLIMILVLLQDEAFTPYAGTLDPRLDYTVGRRGIDYNGYGAMGGKDWVRASFDDISGPYLAKKNVFTNGDDANAGVGGWGQNLSGLNYHIMRYADVLLMAAEANVETVTLTAGQTLVNQFVNVRRIWLQLKMLLV